MLEINNLHLTRGKDKILNGVTFEIRINQIVGIYGSISSGKTSMVEALFNLSLLTMELSFLKTKK